MRSGWWVMALCMKDASGGTGRRKVEARIVPLCRLPNESLSSNKAPNIVSTNLESVSMSRYACNNAKKLLEDRSWCIKSRFVYVWIKSLKKCRIIASRMPGGTCESKSFFAVLFCIVWTMNKCNGYWLWLSICILIKKQDNMLKNMEAFCLCVKSMC